MLFRMEFFIEGKHLEKVLSAVSNVALNMKPPQPVVNATATKGRTLRQTSSAPNQMSRIIEKLGPLKKGDKLTAEQLRKGFDAAGVPHGNYSSIITQMKNVKFLKTTAERGNYIVVREGEARG